MNWKTTLLLVLLLATLAGLVFRQVMREAADVHLVDERLFEGVQVERVHEVRIDHLVRGINIRLERDAQGAWFLTDPLAYPADNGLIQLLLEDVARGRVMPVPEEEGGERELGFDPPQIVLVVVESTPMGELRHRVELGALDLDGQRIHVRRNGRYFRSLRRLFSTLDREVEEFRSQRMLHLKGRDIVEVHRTGKVQYDLVSAPEDLTVSAYLDGGVWHAVQPVEARLDPMDVGVLVYGIAGLEVDRFVEDEVRDPTRYGFDDPVARLSLGLTDGKQEVLLLSRLGNSSPWYVMREGAPYVWSIDDQVSLRLLYPFEAMLEGHFMNTRRGDVTALQLGGPEGELRIERGRRDWTVSRRASGEEWSAPLRADARIVEEWLGRLETLEVSRFLLDEVGQPFSSDLTLHVETPSGVQGGRLGEEREEGDGEPSRLFLRDGDEVVGLLPAWTAELAASTRLDFLSLDLMTLDEVLQQALELVHDGERRRYTRDDRGLWHAQGVEAEALELVSLLDPLLFLSAEEHLAQGAPLEDAVEVTFIDMEGARVSFSVGLAVDASGAPRCELVVGGARAVAKVQGLHEGLTGLFAD